MTKIIYEINKKLYILDDYIYSYSCSSFIITTNNNLESQNPPPLAGCLIVYQLKIRMLPIYNVVTSLNGEGGASYR